MSAKCSSAAGKMLEVLGPGMVQSTGCGCIHSSGLHEACRVRLGSCLPSIQVVPNHRCLNGLTVHAIHLVHHVILPSRIRPRMTAQYHQGRSSCHAVGSSRCVKMIRLERTALGHQVPRTDSSACRYSASSSREIPSNIRKHFLSQGLIRHVTYSQAPVSFLAIHSPCAVRLRRCVWVLACGRATRRRYSVCAHSRYVPRRFAGADLDKVVLSRSGGLVRCCR